MQSSNAAPKAIAPSRSWRFHDFRSPSSTTAPTSVPTLWIKPASYAAVYVGWGTTYLAMRVGVQSLGPASFLGVRFLLAALILLPIVIFQQSLKNVTLKQLAHSSLQGILILIAGILPVAYAEKTLPSNITAVIIASNPIAFAIFDRLLYGTKIGTTFLIGFLAGISGIALLAFGDTQGVGPGVTPLGLALVICGSLGFSFGSVFSRKLAPVQAPLAHVLVQYFAAGAVLLAIALAAEGFGWRMLASCTPAAWTSLLYISIFPSLLSYTAYMWLLKNEPSSRISTTAQVNPIVAVIAGALVLGEAVSANVVIALALVIFGTIVNFHGKARART